MKLLIAIVYYLIYTFLFYVSYMGIVGAAMNRGSSYIAELGFYVFISALIIFPIILVFTFKKITKKIILAVGGIPIIIYIPFFIYYVSTNDIYF